MFYLGTLLPFWSIWNHCTHWGFEHKVLSVFFLPVNTDCHQIENWWSTANDVRGDVKVANNLGQSPHAPIYLEKVEKLINITKFKFNIPTLVYYNQLSGATCTQKLVEIFCGPFSDNFSSFQLLFIFFVFLVQKLNHVL